MTMEFDLGGVGLPAYRPAKSVKTASSPADDFVSIDFARPKWRNLMMVGGVAAFWCAVIVPFLH